MNIIFVSNGMTKPRVLTTSQFILAVLLLVAFVSSLTALLILPQGNANNRAAATLLRDRLHIPLFRPQQHIDALALQLGELQARVMRLDALSDRLSKMAGVQQVNIDAQKKLQGQGGPEVLQHKFTESELQQQIDELAGTIEARTDKLSAIEAMLLQRSMKENALPNEMPVKGAYNSSSYGWRVDPFTGNNAFHEGLDFPAQIGTPIYAAASGIVTTAELTPDYGKIIKIDHGSGVETRYAHASRLLVTVGERVEKGQLIAEVGSTGRSTGAHLHFEVRLNGDPLDPRKYLVN
ncbi:MAG TPA: M23 family metallopeptidase [Methylophilaceae bacterium]|jgi:murein DD-endopeptidase MepM/ murein hydrolase activator NlpD